MLGHAGVSIYPLDPLVKNRRGLRCTNLLMSSLSILLSPVILNIPCLQLGGFKEEGPRMPQLRGLHVPSNVVHLVAWRAQTSAR